MASTSMTPQEIEEQKLSAEERGYDDDAYRQESSTSGYYFTSETDKAIQAYNDADSEREKNRIWREHLQDPFEQLVGAIFAKYKFSYFDVPYDDVKQRVLHHIIEKIHMYQEGKGKGFSYFSTIARNKFIQINNKNYNRYKKELRLDREEVNFDVPQEHTFEDRRRVDEFFEGLIDHWEKKLNRLFSDPKELEIANAFLEILRKRKTLESFNKKNVYMMVREQTGVNDTQLITNVRKTLEKDYKRTVSTYRKHGEFDVPNEFFNF